MRNLIRAATYGVMIALMCDVLIVTLAYIYRVLDAGNLLSLQTTDLVTNFWGWVTLILVSVFMSRTILRTVLR